MIYFQAETQKALNAGTCKLVPQPTCLKKKKKSDNSMFLLFLLLWV